MVSTLLVLLNIIVNHGSLLVFRSCVAIRILIFINTPNENEKTNHSKESSKNRKYTKKMLYASLFTLEIYVRTGIETRACGGKFVIVEHMQEHFEKILVFTNSRIQNHNRY